MEKTKVFNQVILDKSGSMEQIRQAAIDGFNEVLSGIVHAQQQYADTQEHYVSLVVFSDSDVRVVCDNLRVGQVKPLGNDDYEPYGMTPLYDAIGLSLTRLEQRTAGCNDVAVVVTIITDGLENASREYNRESIRRMIDEMKGKGWAFNFMGANQDSYTSASGIGIYHSRDFDYTPKGTQRAFGFTRNWTERFTRRLNDFRKQEEAEGMAYSAELRQRSYSEMASNAYDEAEEPT